MKEVVMYECDLCNELYRSKEEAYECEGEGKEAPLTEVGAMVDYEVKMGGGFNSFFNLVRVKEIKDQGHYLIYYFEQWHEEDDEWGDCDFSLDNLYGNSGFEELCTVK